MRGFCRRREGGVIEKDVELISSGRRAPKSAFDVVE
jgi:hypothetical protein